MNRLLGYCVVVLSIGSPSVAQCPEHTFAIQGAPIFTYLGNRVGLSGNRVLLKSEDGVHAYTKVAGTWNHDGPLVNPPGNLSGSFGDAIEVDGDLAFVSDHNAEGLTGRVYIYQALPGGWSYLQAIESPAPSYGQRFGASLDADGDRLVVGSSSRRVYVFDRVGGIWTFTTEFGFATPQPGSTFGKSVRVQGDRILVSDPGRDFGSVNGAGRAFVYEKEPAGWIGPKQLLPSIQGEYNFAGNGISLSGDRAVIATGSIDPRAHIFERQVGGTWVETGLIPQPPGDYYTFGNAVILDGDRLFVSAAFGHGTIPNSGVVFFYEFAMGAWRQTGRFASPDIGDGALFGAQIELDGDTLLASAPASAGTRGRAWSFDVALGGGLERVCTSTVNSSGAAATMDSVGLPAIGRNQFDLLLRGAPAGRPALFLYGSSSTMTPLGDGFRCTGGTGARLYPIERTVSDGSLQRRLDFSSGPAGSGSTQITQGTTWYFQAWFRDGAAGASGTNLSDALRARFCP